MPPPTAELRLLHVVDSLEVGGLERVVVDLARAQQQRGHRVAVFSITETGGLRDELERAGVPVLIGAKRRPFDLGVLARLRRAATDRDVVHAHNFVPNYYAAAALLALRRAPVQVCTCHDMGARLADRKLRWLFRWSLARTERVAMVGGQVHARYLESGLVPAERAVLVRNGIPVQRFDDRSPARRAAARAALGLPEAALVIGCIGRLVALKNHRLLLDLVPALRRQHPALRVVIVGDGELAAPLQEQVRSLGIADAVILAGPRSDVDSLLPAFDIFALPSLTEGLSIALLEACASGLAIVATAVGGNPEIVRDGETGLLVAPADAEALRDALLRLAADPGARERLGAAARRWVREHASIDALGAAYDALYAQALQAHHDRA